MPDAYARVGRGFGLCGQQTVSLGSHPTFFRGAGDAAAPRGPAGLSRSPGGLVRGGSGCLRWRRRVSAGREGRVGKGSVQRLTVSFGSPDWKVRSSACTARPAPAPGLDHPPASGVAGRYLLPWSGRLSHHLTAISVGKFQPVDAGVGTRAGCAALHARPVQRDVANHVFSQRCSRAGRVDMHLPALLPEQVAARTGLLPTHPTALPAAGPQTPAEHPAAQIMTLKKGDV